MHDSAPKRLLPVVFAAILGTALLPTLASWVGVVDAPPAVKAPAGFGAELLPVSGPVTLRPNYNYSVIAGGAFNARELKRAINSDAVVAHHYNNVDPSTMRPEILKADRLAYVSYRLDGRVYWTKQKVRIRRGETILTNGQTEIRARCGNCVSLEPMMPTSADEPDGMRLDALTDSVDAVPLPSVTGPVLVSWPLGAYPFGSDRPVGVETGSPLVGPRPSLVALAPPFETIADLQSVSEPAHPIPGELRNAGPVVSPPAGVNPPLIAEPMVPDFPLASPVVLNRFDSPFDEPLPFERRDSLIDQPATPAVALAPPVNATPVPEPATLLLFGGGAAALFARRRRSART